MNRKHLGQRFERFVASLFQAEGFRVDLQPKGEKQARPDLLIRSPGGATAVIETKLYRSHAMPMSGLAQAAVHVEYSRRAFGANRAIIVVGGKITPLAQEVLKQFPELLVYDIGIIAFLVAKHPALMEMFEEITREALVFSDPREPEPKEVDIEADLSRPSAPSGPTVIERKGKGDDLRSEIQDIGLGRTFAKKFEEKITEALRYIFDKDLTAWSPQKMTDTNLSYYDLVARVASEHDFGPRLPTSFAPVTSCSNSKTIQPKSSKARSIPLRNTCSALRYGQPPS